MELEALSAKFNGLIPISDLIIGLDVTELLGIQKWEAPISPQLAGQVRGNFPSAVPKTDQERIQNLAKELEIWRSPKFTWEVTEKLEGSSCTFFMNFDNEFEVCSRNLSLKRDENNAYWKAAISNDVENKIRDLKMNIAIQGEIVGPNIQGNLYKLNDVKFFVFDIYDAEKGSYMSPHDRRQLCEQMGLEHVPVINTDFVITQDMQGILDMADGTSIIHDKILREGLVFKCNDFGGPSFKAISNQYLLKS